MWRANFFYNFALSTRAASSSSPKKGRKVPEGGVETFEVTRNKGFDHLLPCAYGHFDTLTNKQLVSLLNSSSHVRRTLSSRWITKIQGIVHQMYFTEVPVFREPSKKWNAQHTVDRLSLSRRRKRATVPIEALSPRNSKLRGNQLASSLYSQVRACVCRYDSRRIWRS